MATIFVKGDTRTIEINNSSFFLKTTSILKMLQEKAGLHMIRKFILNDEILD
ncbi:hypothetical protein JKY72_00515 [Candidatus Gracilibacteria bacterium]|nr:hypothetical protein [Candidatus Gracilibacteria bacterium]